MTTFLIVGLVVLLIAIIVRIAKTSEMVSVVKGTKETLEENSKTFAYIFLGFMFVFFGGIAWSLMKYKSHFLPESASVHGVWIDNIFNLTLAVTGLVFILTQAGLFYFLFKYRQRKDAKAYYYPENHKLEMWWTIIPAIFMTVLVVTGLFYWYKITGPAPEDAMVIEVTGKQFNWIARYPGQDGVLGKRDYSLINDNNVIGMDWNDNAGKDDIIPTELHFVKGKPTKIIIRSRDVMHNFDLPHFRVKMDAVPGIPTTFWFTPKYTTEEMRQITGNPKFNYELACAQICGQSHYAMKMAVKVETQAEFNAWISGQQSYFATVMPAAAPAPAAIDTTAKAVAKKAGI